MRSQQISCWRRGLRRGRRSRPEEHVLSRESPPDPPLEQHSHYLSVHLEVGSTLTLNSVLVGGELLQQPPSFRTGRKQSIPSACEDESGCGNTVISGATWKVLSEVERGESWQWDDTCRS